MLRSVLVGSLLVSSATAEPTPRPAKPVPKLDAEVAPPVAIEPADRTPGIDGHDALGNVIAPDPHPDAAPWPRGMVMTPFAGDDNVLVPGTKRLPWFRSGRPFSKQMLDKLQDGVGAFVQLMVPSAS